MWKLLEIPQQTYFIYCDFNKTQDVTFILYDFKTTWSQTLTFQDLKQKVKLLNRRFDFSDDNIMEALLSCAIKSAVIEEQPNTYSINMDSCILKLKYRVKNCILNYEWTLRKENVIEFQRTMVQPLLLALLGCHQQVEILIDCIRKKDIELKQFRLEGAVLNRKTVVTKPFDFMDFSKKYEECNKTAINFRELAKYLKENEAKNEPETTTKILLTSNKAEPNTNFDEKLNDDENANTKMSPRQRKRKVNEIKMQHLEQHLQIRKQGLEYESSQSQTPSSGSSQTVQETVINNSKQRKETAKHVEKPKNEDLSSPRQSSKCKLMKPAPDDMISEDKTDSGNEDHGRTLRRRKTTSQVNMQKDSQTRFDKEQTKTSPKSNNSEKTTGKSVKSFSTLFISQKKLPEASLESSNIPDVLTDSEDDVPLIKRKKPSGNKISDDATFIKSKKLSNHKCKDDEQLQNRNKLLASKGTKLMFNKDCEQSVSPAIDQLIVDSAVPITSLSRSQNFSHSPTPVIINEISSQLDTIRKELESLEAMRLADLKQRMCKV